jgi:hypothetical protein
MKSTNKPYKTTSTYTSDFPMTEDSSNDSTAMPSPSTTSQDTTSTPSYYLGKYKGLEAFDVVMDFQRDSYNLGVAIAYLLRAGKKQGNPRSTGHLQSCGSLKKGTRI